jgi:integrase
MGTHGQRIKVHLLARGDRPGKNLRLQWLDPRTGLRVGRSAGTPDPETAERARADLEYELNAGLYAPPGKLSWAAFVEVYTGEHLAGKRPHTRRKAGGILQAFGDHARPKTVAAVDERTLSAYAAELHRRSRAAATVSAHLGHLRAALRWAAEQGLTVKAPRVPRVKVPARPVLRTVSRTELERLRDAAGPVLGAVCRRTGHDPAAAARGWRDYLDTLWYTGMRRTEAMYLRWEEQSEAAWVDLAARRIQIPAATCKAGTDSWLPVHERLLPVLAAARRARGRCFELTTDNPERVTQIFRALAEAAGLSCTAHDLRRAFGTRLAPHTPAHVLQRLMRHANLATTLKYYVNLDAALEPAVNTV